MEYYKCGYKYCVIIQVRNESITVYIEDGDKAVDKRKIYITFTNT